MKLNHKITLHSTKIGKVLLERVEYIHMKWNKIINLFNSNKYYLILHLEWINSKVG